MRIYKNGPLEIGVPASLLLPAGAEPIAFSAQHGHLYMWARVHPAVHEEWWHYIVVGTGHDVPPGVRHVGSWVSDDYVWHLFDAKGVA